MFAKIIKAKASKAKANANIKGCNFNVLCFPTFWTKKVNIMTILFYYRWSSWYVQKCMHTLTIFPSEAQIYAYLILAFGM